MSSLQATIRFRDKLDPKRLSHWFGQASSLFDMQCMVSCGKTFEINSEETWINSIARYPSYEFTGETKWEFQGNDTPIKGKVIWPIYDPSSMTASIQFDIFWDHHRKVQQNRFEDISVLIKFCYFLSYSVRAISLLVEPSRLPPEMVEERYARWIALKSQHTLTNLDWICGIRLSDSQYGPLERLCKKIVPPSITEEFAIFVLNAKPFDYKLEEDRKQVREIEMKVFESS